MFIALRRLAYWLWLWLSTFLVTMCVALTIATLVEAIHQSSHPLTDTAKVIRQEMVDYATGGISSRIMDAAFNNVFATLTATTMVGAVLIIPVIGSIRDEIRRSSLIRRQSIEKFLLPLEKALKDAEKIGPYEVEIYGRRLLDSRAEAFRPIQQVHQALTGDFIQLDQLLDPYSRRPAPEGSDRSGRIDILAPGVQVSVSGETTAKPELNDARRSEIRTVIDRLVMRRLEIVSQADNALNSLFDALYGLTQKNAKAPFMAFSDPKRIWGLVASAILIGLFAVFMIIFFVNAPTSQTAPPASATPASATPPPSI